MVNSPTEVLTVISKMFYDPIPYPCPVGSNMMPTQTETVKNKLEEDYVQYSPVLWADPLVTYGIKNSTKTIVCDDMNAIGVDVNQSNEGIGASMDLSGYGLQIKAIVDADISQTGAIRSIMPIPGLKDQMSTATIMHLTDHSTSGLLDEAAITRLFMLQCITTDPWKQVFASSTPYTYTTNMYPDRSKCVAKWTPALDNTEELQIGKKEGTSILYYRTLDEYAALLAGNETESMRFTVGNKTISDTDVVYIPVKSCWRGQTWLIPYILAFTTTAWWNHAMYIDVPTKNADNDLNSGQSLVLQLMPRAATVYIPGLYEHICLVIVDASVKTFPSSQPYKVAFNIEAKRAGNKNFAAQTYAYLGRTDSTQITTYNPEDITQAMNHMCELFATRQEYRRMHVRASVLATSKYNGFGTYPCPDKPPKTTEENEKDRCHIEGVYSFNAKTLYGIGDKTQLDDLGKQNDITVSHIIRNRNNWTHLDTSHMVMSK